MTLYLMRHAHSPAVKAAGVASDFERPISPEGRLAARAAGLYLAETGSSISRILHSPLRRARETAEELQAALGCPRQAFGPLSNEISGPELYEALGPLMKVRQALVAVGHQPQMGHLASFLCGAGLELKPAGMIALDLSREGTRRLLWTRDPLTGAVRTSGFGV